MSHRAPLSLGPIGAYDADARRERASEPFITTKDQHSWVRESNGELIAIVDDEEPVRVALRRLCSAWDLDPRIFASARELFDSLHAALPDCLILDVHMPGLGGLDALAWLLQRGISIPAIVITGRDDDGMRVRAAAAGAFAYLCKPIEASVLLDAIRRALASGPRAAMALGGAPVR